MILRQRPGDPKFDFSRDEWGEVIEITGEDTIDAAGWEDTGRIGFPERGEAVTPPHAVNGKTTIFVRALESPRDSDLTPKIEEMVGDVYAAGGWRILKQVEEA